MKMASERSEIDTVLRGLSEVDPPLHLGEAIARELIRSAKTEGTARRRRPWSSLWQPATLAGACAAGIAFALIVAHRSAFHFSAPSEPARVLPEQARAQPPVPPMRPTLTPFQQPVSAPKVATGNPREEIYRTKQRPSHSAPSAFMNQPAPVAPLSEQEKLLLRVVESRDPVQLASLNSDLQEAIDTTRRNDFIKLTNGGTR